VLTARLLPCDARAATSVAFVAQQVIVKVKREVKPDPLLSVKDGPSSNVKMGSNLRKMLLDEKVELYKGMGKLTNCGGAGQCNLCFVDVLEGGQNLSPRTAVEEARLKKRPASYRLACQTLVNGDVTVEVPSK